MDSRRLVIFILLSLGLLFLWEKYISPPPAPANNTQTATPSATSSNQPITASQVANESAVALANTQIITVTTNLIQAQISPLGGDLRNVSLLNHGRQDDVKQPYQLLLDTDNRVFIAQTGLVANANYSLPTHNSVFIPEKYNYVLEPNQDKVVVKLKAIATNGLEIIKTYTFKRNSYIADVGYQIINNTDQALSGVTAYWRLLRDEQAPGGETKFANTFTGPAYYTNDAKFNTIKFSDLAKNDVTYPELTNNGWVGFIQHYFAAIWLLNQYNTHSVCSDGVQCRLNFKPVGNLASAGVLTDLPVIQPHSSYSISVPLFVG
ncbi:MAG: membrane protein insertase YidC, partial [Burkholderiales bacterium]